MAVTAFGFRINLNYSSLGLVHSWYKCVSMIKSGRIRLLIISLEDCLLKKCCALVYFSWNLWHNHVGKTGWSSYIVSLFIIKNSQELDLLIILINLGLEFGFDLHHVDSHPICKIYVHPIHAVNLDVLQVALRFLININTKSPRFQKRLKRLRILIVVCGIHLQSYLRCSEGRYQSLEVLALLNELLHGHRHVGVLLHVSLNQLAVSILVREITHAEFEKRHRLDHVLANEVVKITI